MKSEQKLSFMFWLRKSKASKKDGRPPLYVRVTIDGADTEISACRKIHPDFWDSEKKIDSEPGREASLTNSKIRQIEERLKAHFLILVSQHDTVTPLMLKNVTKANRSSQHRNFLKRHLRSKKTYCRRLKHSSPNFKKW